jgi:hypothetical protein
MYLLSKHDPCPPLDRRWQRANYLVEHRLDPSPEDDGWVRQAITFLSALTACPDEDTRRRLGERMPALAQAHALRQADPPLLRWVVEARVLAREDFPTIGRKCGLLPEAIAAYEALFFAVLGKLDAPSWIACQVIGRKLQTGMTEHDLDVLWRFAGYNYGPVMLDALVHNTTSPLPPETPAEVAEALAREAESLFARKRALAVQLLPITPETAPTVLKLAAHLGFLKLRETEERATPETSQPAVQALAAGLLAEMGANVAIQNGEGVQENMSHGETGPPLEVLETLLLQERTPARVAV